MILSSGLVVKYNTPSDRKQSLTPNTNILQESNHIGVFFEDIDFCREKSIAGVHRGAPSVLSKGRLMLVIGRYTIFTSTPASPRTVEGSITMIQTAPLGRSSELCNVEQGRGRSGCMQLVQLAARRSQVRPNERRLDWWVLKRPCPAHQIQGHCSDNHVQLMRSMKTVSMSRLPLRRSSRFVI